MFVRHQTRRGNPWHFNDGLGRIGSRAYRWLLEALVTEATSLGFSGYPCCRAPWTSLVWDLLAASQTRMMIQKMEPHILDSDTILWDNVIEIYYSMKYRTPNSGLQHLYGVDCRTLRWIYPLDRHRGLGYHRDSGVRMWLKLSQFAYRLQAGFQQSFHTSHQSLDKRSQVFPIKPKKPK